MRSDRPALVPRFAGQGYGEEELAQRRAWLEEVTGARLEMVGAGAIPGPTMRGNIENPIGAAQVPLGVAGPLRVLGEHADGTYYVPLATTEGALVRSYERGMVALTRAGGVTVRVLTDENRATPQFIFADVATAVAFARALPELTGELRAAAEATTRHGRLLRVVPRVSGHDVLIDLVYSTGDAGGANLVARASDAVCRLLAARYSPRAWTLMSGAEGEKRASATLFAGGKGKSVVAGARIPPKVLRTVLGVEAAGLAALCRRTAAAQIVSGTVGANAQIANGLAALFIACGQDVANITNAATGVTTLEAEDDGTLVASLCLPSLVVATVGGGTAIGTAPECLALLGCVGTGRALAFAEIIGGALLAGELSFSAALVAGDHAAAHERYGRNRPSPAPPR